MLYPHTPLVTVIAGFKHEFKRCQPLVLAWKQQAWRSREGGLDDSGGKKGTERNLLWAASGEGILQKENMVPTASHASIPSDFRQRKETEGLGTAGPRHWRLPPAATQNWAEGKQQAIMWLA